MRVLRLFGGRVVQGENIIVQEVGGRGVQGGACVHGEKLISDLKHSLLIL